MQEPGHLASADEAARDASQACAAAYLARAKHGAGGMDREDKAAKAREGHLRSDHVSVDTQEEGGGIRGMASWGGEAGEA